MITSELLDCRFILRLNIVQLNFDLVSLLGLPLDSINLLLMTLGESLKFQSVRVLKFTDGLFKVLNLLLKLYQKTLKTTNTLTLYFCLLLLILPLQRLYLLHILLLIEAVLVGIVILKLCFLLDVSL